MREYLILALDSGETEIRFGAEALERFAAMNGCYVDEYGPYLRDVDTAVAMFSVTQAPHSTDEVRRMSAFAQQLRDEGWRGARLRGDSVDLILAKSTSLEDMVALANAAWEIAQQSNKEE